MACPNCGDSEGGHFCPPSLGESGFYVCEKKETAMNWMWFWLIVILSGIASGMWDSWLKARRK